MKSPKRAISLPRWSPPNQVAELRREGVNAFHFYTLNRADLVYAICRTLDLGLAAAA